MKKHHSFREVLDNDYYNTLHNALSNYITKNINRLDVHSNIINKADNAELLNMFIKYLDISDTANDYIDFKITVVAGIRLYESVRWDNKTDDINTWFCISCYGRLNDGLHNFKIYNIDETTQIRKSITNRLTESLVPIIPKEQFDAVAESFLQDCGLGEAINVPMRIPVKQVAERMGLIIKETRLSRHLTVFGEMVFHDCVVEYYDETTHTYKQMHVSRGTILVDTNIYFMRNLGCWNNTVIHECVHWYEHKKYHELKRLFDKSADRISCHVYETDRYRSEWTPYDWMEWHANGIAPRILMPKPATTVKIEELIKQCVHVSGMDNWLAILERVMSDLSDFYAVSRISAKLRMIELGYTEAEGVATYVDDHYISNYAFAADSKKGNQTFSISLRDSFYEYYANQDFRNLIDSDNFTYIDGHYVINDPKYVARSSFNGPNLTKYAKLHVNECCVRFDLLYNPSVKEDITDYLNTVEFRKATPNYKRVPKYTLDNHNEELFNRSEKLKRFHEEYVEEYEFINKAQLNFAQTAWAHIERLHCDRSKFCKRTLLSEKTYDRLRDNEIRRPSFETVMLVCIGLGLGGICSEQLVELAGYKLNAERLGYKKVLYSFHGHSVFECDEIITGLGLPSIIPASYRINE